MIDPTDTTDGQHTDEVETIVVEDIVWHEESFRIYPDGAVTADEDGPLGGKREGYVLADDRTDWGLGPHDKAWTPDGNTTFQSLPAERGYWTRRSDIPDDVFEEYIVEAEDLSNEQSGYS